MRHISPFDLVKRERKAHRYIISEWRFSKRGEFFFLKMKNKHWLEGMLKKNTYIYITIRHLIRKRYHLKKMAADIEIDIDRWILPCNYLQKKS